MERRKRKLQTRSQSLLPGWLFITLNSCVLECAVQRVQYATDRIVIYCTQYSVKSVHRTQEFQDIPTPVAVLTCSLYAVAYSVYTATRVRQQNLYTRESASR